MLSPGVCSGPAPWYQVVRLTGLISGLRMPRPRFHKLPAQARAALLDAAAEAFARHGFQGASLNGVLARAGLSKGAFYYCFDDKADLAITVLEAQFRPILDATGLLTAADHNWGFWTVVQDLAQRTAQFCQDQPRAAALVGPLAAVLLKEPSVAQAAAPLFHQAAEATHTLLQQGQRTGAVRQDVPVPVLVALMQAIRSTLEQTMMQQGDPTATGDWVALQVATLRRVLEPR